MSILQTTLVALDRFESAEMDIVELQSRLETAEDSLDGTYDDILKELRQVNADIEEIRFTMLAGEQRAAAIRNVEGLREMMKSALDSNE